MARRRPPLPAPAPSRGVGYATAALFVVGWLLVTHALALMGVPHVWPLSVGLLFLALPGLKLFALVVLEGVWVLIPPRAPDGEAPDA